LPRILIADNHPLFRIGLRYTLRQQADVIAEVGSGSEALAQALALKPDVVLLDIGMPGDGIAACQHICNHVPDTIVVMLANSDEYGLLQLAKHAGAHGFVDKDSSPENFLTRIHEIVSKPQQDWFPVSNLPSLTRRERQVLELMALGEAKKDIAAALGISPETVKDYVRTLYRKLKVKDRLLAVRRAREVGLLRDQPSHQNTAHNSITQDNTTTKPTTKLPTKPPAKSQKSKKISKTTPQGRARDTQTRHYGLES
jgi:DNA-binding NarL/FixJ family response regulator